MRSSTRMIAIACAVATGPLLAHTAIGIRDYVSSAPDDEGFTLDGGGFIDPGEGGLTPQCVWDGDVCVVTGSGPGKGGGFGGGGGGTGGGGDCSADPSRCEGDPPPTGPDAIPVTGRNCPAEQTAVQTAMNLLYNNSPTARQMMDVALVHGVQLQVIQVNLSQVGGQGNNRFDPVTGIITWDPFLVAVGNNLNNSPYTLSPIMMLAHEFVHAAHRYNPAYQTETSEPLIMAIANQIAIEMNAATGSSYNTNRDNHIRTGQHYTHSPTSTMFSVIRPDCD